MYRKKVIRTVFMELKREHQEHAHERKNWNTLVKMHLKKRERLLKQKVVNELKKEIKIGVATNELKRIKLRASLQ